MQNGGSKLPTEEKQLSIIDGLLIIFGIYLLGNGLQMIFYDFLVVLVGFLPGGDTGINRLLISQIMQTLITVGLIAFFLIKVRGQKFASIGLKPFQELRWLPLALVGGGLLYFFTTFFLGALSLLFPELAEPQNVSNIIAEAGSTWQIIAVIISVVILAPIGEELLFRGYIYHSLTPNYSPTVSMLITSAMFGAMHFDFLRFLPLTMVGFFLNLVAVKSKSLYGSMLMHATWNMVMVAVLLWMI